MSEYIERDAVKDMLKRECSPRVMAYLVDELCEIPAADVRPVVHGIWQKMYQSIDGTSDYECSACGGLIVDVPDDDEHPLCGYCPNCGADMGEGET